MKFVKNIISIICCLAVLCAMFISGTITASAANDVKVEIISSAIKAEPGDRFLVSYSFKNADEYKYGLTAFTGILKFDSSKVRCTKATHSSFDNSFFTTNKSLDGEIRTLYAYANLNKKPGVNSDAAFVTYEFLVKKGAVGDVKFALSFDTVVTTDYDKEPVENITLTYDTPSCIVKIVNPGAESTSSQATSSSATSNTTSSKPTSSATSSNTGTNSSSKAPTSSSTEGNTTVKDEYLNPNFTSSNIADGDEQQIDNATDTSAIQSQLTESAENMISKELSESEKDDSGSPIFMFIIIAVIGLAAAIGLIITLIILARKKK
ncbi:MAG: hypothetical protein IIW79_03225 [Clostridia bacterium]|nr:hypothetical protein [Clostridia bacterium]